MRAFYINNIYLEEFRHILRRSGMELSRQHSKISEVQEMLKDQKGLGLGEIKMRLGELSVKMAGIPFNLNGDDRFLKILLENTQETEEENKKILELLNYFGDEFLEIL